MIIFYCLNLGLSSPHATAHLPSAKSGAFNPSADPGLGFGLGFF